MPGKPSETAVARPQNRVDGQTLPNTFPHPPMTEDHVPTERTGRPVSVILLRDGGRERIDLATYSEAIETIKAAVDDDTVAKLEAEDGEIVFRSDEMDIEHWENEWKRAKRRASVDVEERECPYENVGCIADDRCVQCQMDEVQKQS